MFMKVNVIIIDADKDDDEQRDSETSAGWDPPIGLISMLIEFLGRAAGWDGAAGEDADSRKDVVEKQEGATKDKEDDITSDTGRKRKRSG